MEVVVGEAEAGHDVGAGGLDDHVGRLAQPEEEIPALRFPELERHRPLAAVVDPRGRLRPIGVATGRLDLDDVRAVLGEEQHPERTGHTVAQVQNPQAPERGWRTSDSVLHLALPSSS